MLLRKSITARQDSQKRISFTETDAFDALHAVATEKFGAFEGIYERLSRGLRKQRKYKSYELILSSFTVGELSFSLTGSEIAERIRELPVAAGDVPPASIIARTLSSLSTLQAKMGIDLLEWCEQDGRLYIVEPTFLFYLRWRKARTAYPSWSVVMDDLLARLSSVNAQGRHLTLTFNVGKPSAR